MAIITQVEFDTLLSSLDIDFKNYVNNYNNQCKIGNYRLLKEHLCILLGEYMWLMNDYRLSDPTNLNLLTGSQMDDILRHLNIILKTEYNYSFT